MVAVEWTSASSCPKICSCGLSIFQLGIGGPSYFCVILTSFASLSTVRRDLSLEQIASSSSTSVPLWCYEVGQRWPLQALHDHHQCLLAKRVRRLAGKYPLVCPQIALKDYGRSSEGTKPTSLTPELDCCTGRKKSLFCAMRVERGTW